MEKVIIFGIGANYKRFKAYLHSTYKIIGLVDNDPNKHGTVDEKLTISSLNIFKKSHYDKILITPSGHIKTDILNQLLEAGFDCKKIKFLCDVGLRIPIVTKNAEEIDKELISITERNYSNKLKKLQKKKRVRVAFVVCYSNALWNKDSLYQKMKSSKKYYPMVLLTDLNSRMNENYLFFKERNYETYMIKNLSDILAHKPDIVFYDTPWYASSIENYLSPFYISKYALCLYFSYGIGTSMEIPYIFNAAKFFFKLLYKHFLFDLDEVQRFKTQGIHNVIATGNPKLDVYTKPIKSNPWRESTKIKIIYAPHAYFTKELEREIQIATFIWNGKQILQMAKDNPHTEWFFKPHPALKRNFVSEKIMSEQEIDEYYNEWAKIGQIYDMGDYFDLFRTSDFLITDCDAFLTEYLPTGNPVILLDSGFERVSIARKSSRHYYKVHNLTELEQSFNMLVNLREDPLKAERQKDASEIKFNSTDNIFNELLKI